MRFRRQPEPVEELDPNDQAVVIAKAAAAQRKSQRAFQDYVRRTRSDSYATIEGRQQ